ncbi:type II secretion system F family protein [Alcaligenaceae bacterium]|nr:type II secretion system F family protein [Alcaligenaceae bacterium]
MALSSVDWLILAALLITIIGGGMYLNARSSVRARLNQRLSHTARVRVSQAAGDEMQSRAGSALVRGFQVMGKALPLFDAAQRSEMNKKLVSAGYRQVGALPLIMGVAACCAMLMAVLVVVKGWPLLADRGLIVHIVSVLVAIYIGLMMPRIVLDRLVVRRQKDIQRNFPDALDLLVVCTNAGLGLNAALQRVAEELAFLAPELADELELTSGQLQLSGDMAQVLHELADRIGLASIRSLVSTLIQSRQFGTPIGQALRVLSRSERTARLMRTEEAAAKLAVKITLPMMLFILPTVLIVAAGPAALQLMKMFAH